MLRAKNGKDGRNICLTKYKGKIVIVPFPKKLQMNRKVNQRDNTSN
jgi:hypothetical protein